MHIKILSSVEDFCVINKTLTVMIQNAELPLTYDLQEIEKLSNKLLKRFFVENDETNVVLTAELDKNSNLICSLCTSDIDDKNKPRVTKVSLDWHKLQRRIVTAGRKSELLLQACKLIAGSKVLDATAGFGHDSLIMASSGANLTMVEQNPIMALLLILERKRMSTETNWQGLMGRLDVKFGRFPDGFISGCGNDRLLSPSIPNQPIHNQQDEAFFNPALEKGMELYDTVYLDPMFPIDSYERAKVGKGMQVLHSLATPPTAEEEQKLLQMAKRLLAEGGRVVVKRPKNAPFFAKIKPYESWANDVVRFDGYFN